MSEAKQHRTADGSYSKAWRRFSTIILPTVIRSMMGLEFRGMENVPPKEGMILAANHLSYTDILALSLFVYRAGRYPVFLAKSSLFDIPVLGPILIKLGQLPVYRDQANAGNVLQDADRISKAGACVMFYPESTVTRDPDLWPMVAKTGVARLALSGDLPVIPVAHWGAQRLLPYGKVAPRLLPRKQVRVLAGPPVDLSEFKGQPLTSTVLRAATDKIMGDVAALLGDLRGETPPATPFHWAAARRQLRQDLRALKEAADAQAGDAQVGDTPAAGQAAPDQSAPGPGSP